MNDELINISDYCSTILIRYGHVVHMCNAIYEKDDNSITFSIVYNYIDKFRHDTYQYSIQDFNFIMTKTEVLVNSDTIDIIEREIEKRLCEKVLIYGKEKEI